MRTRLLKPIAAFLSLCLVSPGLMGTSANTVAFARQATPSSNIKDYVSAALDDFSATMKVKYHDDQAGQKINESFGFLYKLRGDVTIRYKEENRLRLDGFLGASRAIYIVSGTKQYVRISGVGINTTDDLGKSPGKRKTLLDVGLISNGYLAYTEAQFLGVRPVAGLRCAVFKISYQDKKEDTSHRIVWIDPKTKITVKREEYSQIGKLNATFYYKGAKEVSPGIWFPSTIEVVNNEGQKAGATDYRNVKVNQKLEDSLFRL